MRKVIEHKEYTCLRCEAPFVSNGNNVGYCTTKCNRQSYYEAHMLIPEWRIGKLVSMAKNRSSNKGVPFNIDSVYMMELYDGKCAISGIQLELGRADKGKVHPYAPSIDRIEPSLGYVKGNVRIVTYQMNVALSEFGLVQFEEMIKLYLQNRSSI